jgi:hypothetical protein
MAAFFLVKTFVFKIRAGVFVSIAKYLTLVIIMGFISYHFIRGLNSYLGVVVLAAKLLSEGILFLGNFAIQRDVVFAKD